MSESDSFGSLSIFLGPMYSGKTSKLIERYTHYTKNGEIVMAVNYSKDTRYTSDPFIVSHDKTSIPCILVSRLSEAFSQDDTDNDRINRFMESDVILINECQFFPDIVEWVKMAVSVYKKRVYICGLNGDYTRRPFGNWMDLISFCDSVIKLHSECRVCKTNSAIFSHRISNKKEQIIIGNDYIPLCRQCFEFIN
jgi:thymidine kinase